MLLSGDMASRRGALPPVSTLPGDEVEADKASHGVRHQNSWPAIIHLDSMLNQRPHPVKVARLHKMTVSNPELV